MIRNFLKISISLVLLFGSTAVTFSDERWEKGKSAYLSKDYATAIDILLPYADSGWSIAQLLVAQMLGEGGNGISEDLPKSAMYYELATEQGLLHAQYNTAANYDVGRGVLQDFESSKYWYRVCASQTSSEKPIPTELVLCRHFLAIMFMDGEKIPRDYAKAKYWFLKAAELGAQTSMLNLGVMYANGNGVIQDYVSAHMWFNLASALGEKKAIQYREKISKSMTNPQISEAQKLARKCVQKKYKFC